MKTSPIIDRLVRYFMTNLPEPWQPTEEDYQWAASLEDNQGFEDAWDLGMRRGLAAEHLAVTNKIKDDTFSNRFRHLLGVSADSPHPDRRKGARWFLVLLTAHLSERDG